MRIITVDETNTSKNLSGDDQSMEHTVQQSKDRSSFRLRDIRLPDVIRKKVAKQYLTALLITLLTIWICIFYRNPSYVCGLAISGALIYLGISAKLDFAAGKFQELPVICVSSTDNLLRKTTHVVFRTNDEIPAYYEFYVPGRQRRQFLANFTYIIYFKEDNPKQLFGYTQL